VRAWSRALGPGLVSGAADDDPSGIATYSQAGAQFGFTLLWTALLTTPLMIAIQMAAARVGRVTGRGIGGNLAAHYPRPLVVAVVGLLVLANTLNIAADVAAMGEALQLLLGGPDHGHALVFGVLLAVLQVKLPYERLAALLRWLCLALLAYVAVLFYVHVDWRAALHGLLVPRTALTREALMMVVAVLGTTISPYLFFWQAGQEIEEMRRKIQLPLLLAPQRAAGALLRIRVDTISGMLLSNVIALAIMLAAAATLHQAGIADIGSAAQAAEALRPLAGDQATLVFAVGVIGTGMLAVPVLAGSAAYAVAETFGWRAGLDHHYSEAQGFYAILVGATLIGTALDFTPLDPIKALFYSALANGVIAVPIMAMLVLLASNERVLGPFVLGRPLKALAWAATALMAAAVAAMFWSMLT
jgi:NRAMP (natural resistance-associated macrophage protein)-like metal ion transporter